MDRLDDLQLVYADAQTPSPALRIERNRRLHFKRWVAALLLLSPIMTVLIASGSTYIAAGFVLFCVLAAVIFYIEPLRRHQGPWLLASVLLAFSLTMVLHIVSRQTIVIDNQSDDAVKSVMIMLGNRPSSVTVVNLRERSTASVQFHDLSFNGAANIGGGEFADSKALQWAHAPYSGSYHRTCRITIKRDHSVEITWP